MKSEDRSHKIAKMVVFIPFIAFSLWLTIELFLQGRLYQASGWVICTVFVVFIFVWSLITPKKIEPLVRPTYSRVVPQSEFDESRGLVTLIATNDQVKLNFIEQALEEEGIDCIILDRHGSSMMGFLQDVETKIMVSDKDYSRSMEIIEAILAGN